MDHHWSHFSQIYLFNNTFALSKFGFFLQTGLIVVFCFFIFLIKTHLIEKRSFSFEIYIFLCFSLFGLSLILVASNLIVFFLGFELQAFALCALASYKSNSLLTSEAVIKYFLFGAFFSSLLILGLSFIYGFFGTLNLVELTFV